MQLIKSQIKSVDARDTLSRQQIDKYALPVLFVELPWGKQDINVISWSELGKPGLVQMVQLSLLKKGFLRLPEGWATTSWAVSRLCRNRIIDHLVIITKNS